MNKFFIGLYFSFGMLAVSAQSVEQQIQLIDNQLSNLDKERKKLEEKKETLTFSFIQQRMELIGFPFKTGETELVRHLAYTLSYNEVHEQANWVMHMITTDVIKGNSTRSNDFRPDSLVKTGSSVEQDYFTKTKKEDGSGYTYNGFGYDRGHLAPSADFRWSDRALSESYFYSNMSPQVPDFNRLKWAELEDWMRSYVDDNKVDLYVVTAPVLSSDLKKIEQGVNRVSIPNYFVKASLDMVNHRAIAFVVPNEKLKLPLEAYAVTIDSAEKILGYDLFPKLPDTMEVRIEAAIDIKPWMPEKQKDDAMAIDRSLLPKGAINTYMVENYVKDDKNRTVCGTIISTKRTNKGHVFLDMDKKFPHQVFSISIFESSIKNFSYAPEVYLLNQQVCVTGRIGEYNNVPNMVLENEKQVKLFEVSQ